jgi:hypothetical protein
MAYQPPRTPLVVRLLLCLGTAVTIGNTYQAVVRRDLRQSEQAQRVHIQHIKALAKPVIAEIERRCQEKGEPPAYDEVVAFLPRAWNYQALTRGRWHLYMVLERGHLLYPSDGNPAWNDECTHEAVGEGWFLYTPR